MAKKAKISPVSIFLLAIVILGGFWFINLFKDDISSELALGHIIQDGYDFYYPSNFASKASEGTTLAYYSENNELITLGMSSDVELSDSTSDEYCVEFAKVQTEPINPETKTNVLEAKSFDTDKSTGCTYKASYMYGEDDLIIESKATWSKIAKKTLYLVNGTYSVESTDSTKSEMSDAVMKFSIL